ncbi:MAG: hypothetical protein QM733_03785 [Ilumatobacteraceae bacterium]
MRTKGATHRGGGGLQQRWSGSAARRPTMPSPHLTDAGAPMTPATLDRPAATASSLAPAIFERRWRNALARRLGVATTSLHAVFGDAELGTGADRSWRFFDTQVTTGATRTWGPDQPRLSDAYAAVLGNLVPRHNDALRDLLGARYPCWQAFRCDPRNLPLRLPRLVSGAIDVTDVLVSMFQTWAIGQLPAGDVRTAIGELRRPDVVAGAGALLAAAAGRFAWSTTDVDAQTDTGAAPGTSTDSGTAPATARPLTVRFGAGGIAVHVRCNATWHIDGRPAAPGHEAGEGVVPWFDPAALSLARADDDPIVWRRRTPTWTDVFGPDGTMRRIVTGLVVADDIEVLVRPHPDCHRAGARSATALRSTVAGIAGRAGSSQSLSRSRSFAADGCGEGPAERWRWRSGTGAPRVIGLVSAPLEQVLVTA